MLKIYAKVILFAALFFSAVSANAKWPDKTIKLIVPFSPGGVSDVLGRFWAEKLSKALSKEIVVENKPGAGTTLAASYVSQSNPDGYTLFFTDITTQAINNTLYKNLPYNTLKDFSYIALLASTPLVFVVPEDSPVNTLSEFIKLAKEKPGILNYASSGNGTILHLAGETLKTMANIDMAHIPYKGSSEAVLSTLSHQTSATFSSVPPAAQQVAAKKLKALGVTSKNFNKIFPGIPTFNSVVPGYEMVLYSGIIGPKGIPDEIMNKINKEVSKISKDPETEKFYNSIGADIIDISPAEFTKRFSVLDASMQKAVINANAQID